MAQPVVVALVCSTLVFIHFDIGLGTLLPILAKERKSPFFTNLCVKKNIFISFSMKLNCKVLRCFPFSVICWWVNFKQLLPYSFLSNPIPVILFLWFPSSPIVSASWNLNMIKVGWKNIIFAITFLKNQFQRNFPTSPPTTGETLQYSILVQNS